ncbi:MAG TPA: energy-coupling factor transporter transmembrane component T, partial [Clostridiales bacterium]|nr:energy-coupling factor transporter transmembrane component T [Clostridiales bacterium]
FRRADELATAMEARCYRGGKGRTRLRDLAFTGADTKILLVTCIFFTGILLLEYL